MASVAVTYTFTAGTVINSSQVNTDYTDITTWLNNRNSASTSWDGFSCAAAITVTPTTNQVILGTTRTVTISAPTPASLSRVWTIPDITGNGTFMSREAIETITGLKLFQKSSTNTTFSSEIGLAKLQNSSATDGNYAGLSVLDATGSSPVTWAGTQIVAHSAASTNVAGDYLIATKQAGVSGQPVERLRVTSAGNVAVGTAAISTSATDGFLYIPTCAGTPSGTPTTLTGRIPLVYDTTNHKLYLYDGSWKGGTVPGAWS